MSKKYRLATSDGKLSTCALPVYSWASPWGTATCRRSAQHPHRRLRQCGHRGHDGEGWLPHPLTPYIRVCFVPMLITVVLAMFYLLGFEMPK